MRRILEYAIQRDYTKYTSTLEEAWRLSITGLTESILSMLEISKDIPELSPDLDYTGDPLTRFGIIEAQKHMQRGVPLDMFLGLMKYYKQTYLDLIEERITSHEASKYKLFIERCYDRIEIAFCKEWIKVDEKNFIEELQKTNRFMVNEKNTFLTIFESIADPIITLNKENEIINLNFAAVSLFAKGRTPGDRYYFIEGNANILELKEKEIIGKKVTELFPWFKDIIETGTGKKENKAYELEFGVNGETKFYQATFSQMLDVSEKFTYAILALRDITDIKIAEHDLKELNASKDKLFSIIAHDLKSPLSGLIGYSQLLIDDYNDLSEEDKFAFISSIHKISSGINLLLENLLNWARVQTGKIEYNPEELNLMEISASTMSLLKDYAAKKNIIIKSLINEDINIFVDKDMFNTILRNLVSNAIKFTPHGGLIEVVAQETEASIIITVKDNGIGMPEEVVRNLFKIDKTESRVGTDNEEGTGLGLILCKEFVEKNGGNISVISKVGEGTTFTFVLPAGK